MALDVLSIFFFLQMFAAALLCELAESNPISGGAELIKAGFSMFMPLDFCTNIEMSDLSLVLTRYIKLTTAHACLSYLEQKERELVKMHDIYKFFEQAYKANPTKSKNSLYNFLV